MKESFDVRRVVSKYGFASAGVMWSRLMFAAAWGAALSPQLEDAGLAYSAGLGIGGVVGAVSFFARDRERLNALRLALYGLFLAGEVLLAGAGVLACLATFEGVVRMEALLLCGFGGGLFREAANELLSNSNIGNYRGSK